LGKGYRFGTIGILASGGARDRSDRSCNLLRHSLHTNLQGGFHDISGEKHYRTAFRSRYSSRTELVISGLARPEPSEFREVVKVGLVRGDVVDGRFESWSSGNVVISGRKAVTRTLVMGEVKQFLVRRPASRLKAVGIGAGIGFGVGFATGAGAAGSLTDRNNPSFGSRAQAGGGVGLVGAGIGALIGALVGGTRYETIYRSR
jgi:hypothetical protein